MSVNLYLSIAAGARLSSVLFVLCTSSALGILQQEKYSGRGLLKWLFRRTNMLLKRLGLFALCEALLLVLFNLCFVFLRPAYANLISAIPFFGIGILYLVSGRKFALKVPIHRTARLIRLSICYFILSAAFCFGLGVGLAAAADAIGMNIVSHLRFTPFALMPVLMPLILVLSNFVMKTYELPRNAVFIRRAKKALSSSDCIKIGITGSCGKTSVKHMAAAILSEKYSVISTPASYNTPIGIALTVKQNGVGADVFLAEMGARHVGDIAELCDIVAPDYGVVTAVLPQHLESFQSIENIRSEKGILAKRTKRCIVGETAKELQQEGDLVEGEDDAAEEIVCSEEGGSFTLRLSGDTMTVKTPLMGRHAAQDIALAAALCSLVGMTNEEILRGIEKIRPIPHRLELIRANGKYILDDSYNSNVAGARDAVETLRLFQGKKIIVTPGLVELGMLEEKENRELGELLVGLDRVILVGETQVLSVRAGYLEGGGDESKLTLVPTLEKAKEVLAKESGEGDAVLFLNDLPDIY